MKGPQYIAGWLMVGLGLLAITHAAPAFTQTPPTEAFQGLKWGDSANTIKERFRGAAFDRMESCVGEIRGGPESTLGCTVARYTGYRVAGLPFRVSFYMLAPEWVLSEVNLIAIIKSEPAEALAKCKEIEALLSARYGKSQVALNDFPKADGIERLVFWEEGGGSARVTMNCYAVKSASAVSINYHPKFGLDSTKL